MPDTCSGALSEMTRRGPDAIEETDPASDGLRAKNGDVDELGCRADGLYIGSRIDKCMYGVFLRHEFTIRAYEATWSRFRGDGRIAVCTLRYEAYASSCWRAYNTAL